MFYVLGVVRENVEYVMEAFPIVKRTDEAPVANTGPSD